MQKYKGTNFDDLSCKSYASNHLPSKLYIKDSILTCRKNGLAHTHDCESSNHIVAYGEKTITFAFNVIIDTEARKSPSKWPFLTNHLGSG